jgi:hypothetical protein
VPAAAVVEHGGREYWLERLQHTGVSYAAAATVPQTQAPLRPVCLAAEGPATSQHGRLSVAGPRAASRRAWRLASGRPLGAARPAADYASGPGHRTCNLCSHGTAGNKGASQRAPPGGPPPPAVVVDEGAVERPTRPPPTRPRCSSPRSAHGHAHGDAHAHAHADTVRPWPRPRRQQPDQTMHTATAAGAGAGLPRWAGGGRASGRREQRRASKIPKA